MVKFVSTENSAGLIFIASWQALHCANPPPRCLVLGRDSVADLATRYGLDGREIASRWGRVFPRSSRPALGPT
jgi:hypothetical protein